MDVTRWEQPEPSGDHRADLTAWLEYQRHEFQRKLRDLTPEQMAAWSVAPVELSVLGLVRHMTQMEHIYLTWGLGGGEREALYGDDDFAGGSPETVEADVTRYLEEVRRADAAIAALDSASTPGRGHGRPLDFTLMKMLDEYALHAGQAHMLRFAALGEIRR